MTSRHPPPTVGYTHASKVIPVVKSNELASLTVTRALVPLNDRAGPNFPAVVHVAASIAPLFPLPDVSVTVVPAPSLNPYAATRPAGCALTVSTKVSFALNCPSLTLTVIVAVPDWLAAGVTVTVRLAPLPPKTMLPLGTNKVLPELPLTVRLPAAVSTSPTVKLNGPVATPIGVVWSAI